MQILKSFVPGDTTDALQLQDVNGVVYGRFAGPTLPASGGVSYLSILGTLPSAPTSNALGVNFNFHSAGSGGAPQIAFSPFLYAGYTGPAKTAGMWLSNAAAGTGTGFIGNNGFQGYSPAAANYGAECWVTPVTTGTNVGLYSNTVRGAKNFAGWLTSTVPITGGINVGLAAFALNTGGGVHCAVFGSLADYGTADPPIPKAAACFDNGPTTDPIARFRVDGTDAVVIDKNGGIVLASMADAVANPSTLYFSTDAGKPAYKDAGGTVNPLI